MQATVPPWKKELATATRAIAMTVTNSTSWNMKRGMLMLQHGSWACMPPERIGAKCQAEFGVQSSTAITGIEGYVYYEIEGSEDMGCFLFKWFYPILGTRTCTAEPPNQLFHIETPTLTYNAMMEAVWVIESRGNLKRNPVSTTLKKSNASPSRTEEWKQILTKSTRSIVVHMDNKSRYKLQRQSESVTSGIWALLPPENIAPASSGSFALCSRTAITGVWAKLEYLIAGSKEIIMIELYNPLVGSCLFEAKSSYGQIQIATEQTTNNHSTVTFTITPKETKQPLKTSGKVGHKASFKMLTINSSLHETRDTTLPSRAKPQKKMIKENPVDVLNIQGLYSKKARKLFIEKLSAEYPYRIESSCYLSDGSGNTTGPHSRGDGLLIFSRFPILKTFDQPFSNGFGHDSTKAKGILGAKLDLSSILPRKILYIFNAHLQSDPPNASPAELAQAQTVREQQLNICRQFINRWVVRENRITDYSDFVVMLAGDLAIVAENTINVDFTAKEKEEESFKPKSVSVDDNVNIIDPNANKSIESIIENLAQNLNEGNLSFEFACHTYQMLVSLGIPTDDPKNFGMLRKLLKDPRENLILLMSLTWEIIEEEILNYLKSIKQKPTPVEEKKIYLNALLIYIRLVFSCSFLNHEPIYCEEIDDEVESFWCKCIYPRLISRFDALTEKESPHNIKEKLMLCKYQLIRAFETRTGIRLKSSTKEKLFSDDPGEITLNDVDVVNYDGLELTNVTLWDQYKEYYYSSESAMLEDVERDMQFSLIKTPEYLNALSTLMCVDAYRVKHPYLAGFTVFGKVNNLVPKKEYARRVDYLMLWDYLGEENAKLKLQQVECTNIRVKPFGNTPEKQLSTHFALEAEISLKY
eukprot:TRINITY_DN18660_c0_g1_i1.p1 TRINITY_DN18660_c0_g1~~TRINITY_DN18660_c0_g1_i1.p1  ORF type:complete len:869 (+),score=192.17 TRINITY_DN18660_c0_g1_i1:34-2640(+)